MNLQKVRTTTTARVTATVEVTTGSWGPGCQLDQVYRQAAEEAEGTIRRLLSESGGKARLINVERIVAITTDTCTPK
jgi:hypothetical protein